MMLPWFEQRLIVYFKDGSLATVANLHNGRFEFMGKLRGTVASSRGELATMLNSLGRDRGGIQKLVPI